MLLTWPNIDKIAFYHGKPPNQNDHIWWTYYSLHIAQSGLQTTLSVWHGATPFIIWSPNTPVLEFCSLISEVLLNSGTWTSTPHYASGFWTSWGTGAKKSEPIPSPNLPLNTNVGVPWECVVWFVVFINFFKLLFKRGSTKSELSFSVTDYIHTVTHSNPGSCTVQL